MRHGRDLRRRSGESCLGWAGDCLVPAGHTQHAQQSKARRADPQRYGPEQPPALEIRGFGRRRPATQLQDYPVDREERGPDHRRRGSGAQAQESHSRDRKQDDGHDRPTRQGEDERGVLEPPAQSGPRPGCAEQSQRYHHRHHESDLLDDLARVLKGVDQETEYESGHHREQRLVQGLGQRLETKERAGPVHQRHQHYARQRAPAETLDRRLSALHGIHFTLFYRCGAHAAASLQLVHRTIHGITA